LEGGSTPLSLNYVADVTNSLFHGEVVYEGIGWVAFAVSAGGSMVGSDAVIGLPGEPLGSTNPGHYDLGGRSTNLVTLQSPQRSMSNANCIQNETHTVLQFSIPLDNTADPALSINPLGTNVFLLAAGSSNELGYHRMRGAVTVTFTPCEEATTSATTATNGEAEPVPSNNVMDGDEVEVEGYVMDQFFIERGKEP
jgi:hypothetical protein